jgi:hypothetical protein
MAHTPLTVLRRTSIVSYIIKENTAIKELYESFISGFYCKRNLSLLRNQPSAGSKTKPVSGDRGYEKVLLGQECRSTGDS